MDDPYLFKYCAYQIVRRCFPENEFQNVLSFCHEQACGGHFSAKKQRLKFYNVVSIGQLYFEMLTPFALHVIGVNKCGALHEVT